MIKIKDITNCIENIAPLNYAEDFDNVGLLVAILILKLQVF